MWHRWPVHLLVNHLRNILSESVPWFAVLVPASSSMCVYSAQVAFYMEYIQIATLTIDLHEPLANP